MFDIQVTLYLLALLLIYALAARLDEPAALPMDRPLAQSADRRCRLPAWHLVAPPAVAASASAHSGRPVRFTC